MKIFRPLDAEIGRRVATCVGHIDRSSGTANVALERVRSAVGNLEKLTSQTLKGTGVSSIAIAAVHRDRVRLQVGLRRTMGIALLPRLPH